MQQKRTANPRDIRHAAGWTSQKAAHFAGVSVRTLYKFEAGGDVILPARRGLSAAYAQMQLEIESQAASQEERNEC